MKRLVGMSTILVFALIVWVSRAELLRLVPTPLVPMAAHEQYATALAFAGVSTTAAGRAWLQAAEAALEHPVEASPWFSTTAPLDNAPSAATAWQFPARRGQLVTIDLGAAADTVFLDLFTEGGKKRVASAPPRSTTLSYIVEKDGPLIARAQPRLSALETPRGVTRPLGGDAVGTSGSVRARPEGVSAPATAMSYEIKQRLEASLAFPVSGMDGRAIASGFGVARDSGRRHEGIDIFAPRGTPVVAAVDGWITRQTTNRLGGKVVWLWAPSRRVSLYYAHLDRQAVSPGERVAAGDTIGYVGNTGNARYTPPHLHFGVYAALSGAVDPFPFVVDPVMQR